MQSEISNFKEQLNLLMKNNEAKNEEIVQLTIEL
jgi:hypothetical protein